ncbi:hypothetical protein STEG23_029552, partial [Scotinomys teguina]
RGTFDRENIRNETGINQRLDEPDSSADDCTPKTGLFLTAEAVSKRGSHRLSGILALNNRSALSSVVCPEQSVRSLICGVS